jgi:hypothetical protein
MDSGYDGIKQAMELADHLGIPSQELPWELKHVDEYLDKIFDPTLDDLEATGWSMEEYRAADWGGGEYENFERKLGLRECIRELLSEDPMGFVHDLAAASDEFGIPDIEKGGDATLPFSGGDPGFGGGKAIKRAFNANADHQWLSTLDTVHWVEDAYSLEGLVGKSKDELSTTMNLSGDKLKTPRVC